MPCVDLTRPCSPDDSFKACDVAGMPLHARRRLKRRAVITAALRVHTSYAGCKDATGRYKRLSLNCNLGRRGPMHDRSSGDLQGGDELGGKASAAWNTATNLAVISRMTDAPAGADTKPTPAGGVAALAATKKIHSYDFSASAWAPHSQPDREPGVHATIGQCASGLGDQEGCCTASRLARTHWTPRHRSRQATDRAAA